MRVIVVGAGVVGFNAALLLSQEKHDVVVVEQSPERLEQVRRKLDVMTVAGSGAHPDVLEEAGARNAGLLVAATDIDEVNMVSCFTAKQMGTARTVARLRKEEYLVRSSTVAYTALGIDHIVTPEVIAAEEIINILSSGAAIAVEDFGAGKIRMMEYKVGNSPIADLPLAQVSFPKPCKVVAIVRPQGAIIPHGRDSIQSGDHIYVVANREHIADLEPFFGVPKGSGVPRNITIFGGGRIGYRLARMLERYNVSVKIVEQKRDRCELLAAELKNARVICGDEQDLDVLREDAIPGTDAFVGITARGELNILMALLAKQMGVARSIAVFNEPEYVTLSERFGLDAAISPLLLSAGAILKLVRRGQVLSVSILEKQQAEALELVAAPGAPIVGKSLKDAGLPTGAIVGAILRNGKAAVPDGDTQIITGDRVVVVAVPSSVPAIERMFGSA